MHDIVSKQAARIAVLDGRIAELEVGIRRAIHLVEIIKPFVMWPLDDEPTFYDEEWARRSLVLVREALAGKAT